MPFTHLLKCVFLLRASSILGCNFPICSSSLESVLVLFFLSIFWACSLSCLLCRRLLKNMETLRSSTVPEVKAFALSMVCCFCCFRLVVVFLLLLCFLPRFQRNLSLFMGEKEKGKFVWRKKRKTKKKSFLILVSVLLLLNGKRRTFRLMPWK